MPSMVYQWRSGSRLSIDAQMAGEEIEHLRKKANGQLSPATVVDAARNEKHILHPAFEWDDGVAAERFREDQARGLIGALVVTIKPNGMAKTVRAFVNVQQHDTQGYTSLAAALSDTDLRQQVVARALEELRLWEERYRDYVELAAYFEAIGRAKKPR